MCNLDLIEKSMDFAVENIIRYGDTDIFPYPIERQIFRDKKEETTQLLIKMYEDFENLKFSLNNPVKLRIAFLDVMRFHEIDWRIDKIGGTACSDKIAIEVKDANSDWGADHKDIKADMDTVILCFQEVE